MIVIFVLLIEILVGSLLNYFLIQNEAFSYACVFITTIVLSVFIVQRFKGFQSLVLFGLLLRLFLLFADYYDWFPIPNSGADSERFYKVSVLNLSRDYHIYITNYTVYLTSLFSCIGAQRLFAQFLNVVYSIGTIYYVYKSLHLLHLNGRLKKTFMIIVCCLPNLIIFSGLLLRESIIILGTAASVYYFLLWIKKGHITDYLKSVFFVLLGAYMHSGMLGLLLGYLLAFVFYNRKREKVQVRFISVIYLVLAFSFLVLVVVQSGLFTSYLESVLSENAEDGFLKKANYKEEAGSAYLTWLSVGSWQQAILYLPLKVFYFLFSPLPLNWRGVADISVFLLDSCVYLWLLYRVYHSREKACPLCKTTSIFLMIGFWISVSMFAYGTITAGTAMRHRAKFCTLLIVAAGLQAAKMKDDTSGTNVDDKS